jgi:anti-sigma regulatory factor (Ser/Thr protein kinase)
MQQTAGPSELELNLQPEAASVSRARQLTGELAREIGADTENVRLAVSEAVGNAVVHAFHGRPPGAILLTATTKSGWLVITVSDNGKGMTPNIDSPGLGVGISLISKVAEQVNFDSSDAGTTVSMSFPIA